MLAVVSAVVIIAVESLRLRPCLPGFVSASSPVKGCRLHPARCTVTNALKVTWYRVGDAVEAFCEDSGHWYTGIVDQVNSNGTCQVKWLEPTGGAAYSTCSQEFMTRMLASEESILGDMAARLRAPPKERHVDLAVARELLEEHGLSADLLREEDIQNIPHLLDGVREAERRLQEVQPQFWQTAKRTCAVCGAPAGGADGHAEEVLGECEKPWAWWPPGMNAKVTERLRSCSSRNCRFALALGAAWRRQAQSDLDSGKLDYGVHIGLKSLSLGLTFQSSTFHYQIAHKLHGTPALRSHAIQHLYRIIDAQPKHLWATVDLHFLCSSFTLGELPESLSNHLVPEVRAYFLEQAWRQLPDLPEKAVERAILRMLQNDNTAATMELAVARDNAAQQRLGAAMACLLHRAAVVDIEVLTDKDRLAELQFQHTPPSVVLQVDDGANDADGIRENLILDFVFSHGLESNRRWLLKEVGEECGQGLQEVWSDANYLEQAVARRLKTLQQQNPRSRMGRPRRWVLQHMLSPWLAPGGFKVSIRMYVLLSLPKRAQDLRVWLYNRGFVNVASDPYATGTRAATVVHGFSAKQYPFDSFPESEQWFPQIRQITEDLIRTSHAELLKSADERQDSWNLFGVDLMPDENGRVWLLEVNTGPCLFVGEGLFQCSDEAAALTRTMLLDVVDLQVSSMSNSKVFNEPHAANGFIPLLKNFLSFHSQN